uniref:Uncharacterized protein n=1 Tax=Sphingomonas sp. NS2 TaxID=908605 RepID=A0A0D4ZYL3_9SPHN|nr:hypothetical protein plasmid201_046 [Sphingomonas sp. NS2]
MQWPNVRELSGFWNPNGGPRKSRVANATLFDRHAGNRQPALMRDKAAGL